MRAWLLCALMMYCGLQAAQCCSCPIFNDVSRTTAIQNGICYRYVESKQARIETGYQRLCDIIIMGDFIAIIILNSRYLRVILFNFVLVFKQYNYIARAHTQYLLVWYMYCIAGSLTELNSRSRTPNICLSGIIMYCTTGSNGVELEISHTQYLLVWYNYVLYSWL